MGYLLVGFIGITVAWLYGAKLVATHAPPIAPGFTSSGTVQVGDVVTVSVVSIEGCDSETNVDGNQAVHDAIAATITPQVTATLDALQQAGKSGATCKLQVTAIGLLAPGGSAKGSPVTIGVLSDPPIGIRLPFVFLTASIQKIERNGVVVTK